MLSAELNYSMMPTVSHSGSRHSVVVTDSNWLRGLILATPLVGVTLLSKLAIPPFGAYGIGIALALIFIVIVLGAISGQVRVDAGRLAFYALVIGTLGLIQIAQPAPFSLSSLLLLAALSFPYVAALTQRDDSDRIVRFFLWLTAFIACCGIAQYFLQHVANSALIFPIDNYVPQSFLVQGFNKEAQMSYSVHLYRANGVFMLEPSFFSQLLAVAIIVELCTFNNLMRLALFALALIVSYSGTGVLVLAICLPILVVGRRRWDLILIGAAALLLMIPFWEQLHLDHLLNRVSEFGSTQTSAYQRFVGGFYVLERFLWNDPWRTLFGMGAGSYVNALTTVHSAAADMALFKLIFEFGLLGALLYWCFIFYCFAWSPASRLIKVAVGVTYFLNGIYVPFSHGLALSLLVWSAAQSRQVKNPSRRANAPSPIGAPT